MAGTRKKQSANSKTKKKRADTIAKRQQKDKEQVLVELEKTPIIEVASRKAGVSSSTYYRWIKEDSVFARAANDALQRGVQHINDVAESKVISGIYNNEKTYVIFWLKNRHKHFTDKQLQIHEFVDNPLTEERKREITKALENWSRSVDDDEGYVVTNP